MSGHSLVPLRDLILESQNGLSKRSGEDGLETPVLRLADITAGRIDESDPREIRLTAKELAKYALQHGDLVCIRVNGSKALVGRVIQFRASRVWAYCDHFIRLRPNQALVDHRYLAYYFNSQTVRRHIELNMVSSAGQNTVSQGTMLDIPVPCPELETQREIVAELKKQFSRLNEAVANLQRVKANLKRYKASVLKAAVEGRLVETEATLARREGRTFETGEQLLQRILGERRAKWAGKGKYKEPAPLDAIPQAEHPEGWTWCNFEQVSISDRHALKAGPFGSALKKEFYAPAGYKIYGQEQVIAGDHKFGDYYIAEDKYRELENCAVKPGDILVSLVGTTGKVLVLPEGAEPGIINPRLIKLSLNPKFVAAQYASYYLQSAPARSFFKLQAHGGTMEILNLGIVKALPVCLPPLAEQTRIVAEVDRHLSIIREVETEVDANLQRAQALRQATLAKAFSPVPSNQVQN